MRNDLPQAREVVFVAVSDTVASDERGKSSRMGVVSFACRDPIRAMGCGAVLVRELSPTKSLSQDRSWCPTQKSSEHCYEYWQRSYGAFVLSAVRTDSTGGGKNGGQTQMG